MIVIMYKVYTAMLLLLLYYSTLVAKIAQINRELLPAIHTFMNGLSYSPIIF